MKIQYLPDRRQWHIEVAGFAATDRDFMGALTNVLYVLEESYDVLIGTQLDKIREEVRVPVGRIANMRRKNEIDQYQEFLKGLCDAIVSGKVRWDDFPNSLVGRLRQFFAEQSQHHANEAAAAANEE